MPRVREKLSGRLALRLPLAEMESWERFCERVFLVESNAFRLSDYLRLAGRLLEMSCRALEHDVVTQYAGAHLPHDRAAALIVSMAVLAMRSRQDAVLNYTVIVDGPKPKSPIWWAWVFVEGPVVRYGIAKGARTDSFSKAVGFVTTRLSEITIEADTLAFGEWAAIKNVGHVFRFGGEGGYL
jgi:hypothetical protein